MIIKLKAGRTVKIGGESYTVKGHSMENFTHGISVKAKLVLESGDGTELVVEFDTWTPALDDKQLIGLAALLTTG